MDCGLEPPRRDNIYTDMRKCLRKKEIKKERKSSFQSNTLREEHIVCHLKLIRADVHGVHVPSIRTCLKRQTLHVSQMN